MRFLVDTVSQIMGAVASALYITDAYADIEVEGFTCLLIFKNMITFGLTFQAFDWLLEAGIHKLMFLAGSIQVVILALTIPMCMFTRLQPVVCLTDILPQTSLAKRTAHSSFVMTCSRPYNYGNSALRFRTRPTTN